MPTPDSKDNYSKDNDSKDNNSRDNNEEWEKIRKWAAEVEKKSQEKVKIQTDKISTLKYIAVIVIIVLFSLCLTYILYRAYTIPDPKSLDQEVSEMIHQQKYHQKYYQRRHESTVGAGLFT